MKFNEAHHLRKADHNHHFAADVASLEDSYQDWRVTATFYAALHVLQAYFTAKTQLYPTKHQERDHHIQSDPLLQVIWDDYRELKTLSVMSRYWCIPINEADVVSANQHFENIRRHVRSLLNLPNG